MVKPTAACVWPSPPSLLAGLLIVMSEALGDDGLFSLAMVGTVWEADHFHVLLSRHKLSDRIIALNHGLHDIVIVYNQCDLLFEAEQACACARIHVF